MKNSGAIHTICIYKTKTKEEIKILRPDTLANLNRANMKNKKEERNENESPMNWRIH